jgi:hypothetical protein
VSDIDPPITVGDFDIIGVSPNTRATNKYNSAKITTHHITISISIYTDASLVYHN